MKAAAPIGVNPPITRGVLRRKRSRVARWLRRVAATTAAVVAGYAGFLVVDASLRTDAPSASSTPAIERPSSAPARVPGWAWQLHAWQLTPPADRGARPAAAPARVPAWYWDWRRWRLSLAPA